jgi:GNAT superfamily N-acetyltransferase
MEVKKPYKIVEVNTADAISQFLQFPVRLYKQEKNWIRSLDKDIEKVFDPSSNKKLRKGDAIRWILQDSNGQTIGKVAAFFEKKGDGSKHAIGGLGFFDCINDQEAANMLFDACRDWLEEKGMTAMDGPINFGERDQFWGCLVDGFHEPIYNMPYNFSYYNDLFEKYGFQNYFNQYTYLRKITKAGLSPLVKERASRVLNNPDYSFKMMERKHLEKYAEDVAIIFNKAWARFSGVPTVTKAHTGAILKQMKPISDDRLTYIAYHKKEPIAFFIMIPDIFQSIKKFNGKLTLLNKLRLLYDLRVAKNITRIIGRIFGVIPEFQGKGIEGGLVMAFEKQAFSKGFPYTDLELNWIGDFNPIMMKVCEQIGGKIHKTHVTYRYLFDRDQTFERAARVSRSGNSKD